MQENQVNLDTVYVVCVCKCNLLKFTIFKVTLIVKDTKDILTSKVEIYIYISGPKIVIKTIIDFVIFIFNYLHLVNGSKLYKTPGNFASVQVKSHSIYFNTEVQLGYMPRTDLCSETVDSRKQELALLQSH